MNLPAVARQRPDDIDQSECQRAECLGVERVLVAFAPVEASGWAVLDLGRVRCGQGEDATQAALVALGPVQGARTRPESPGTGASPAQAAIRLGLPDTAGRSPPVSATSRAPRIGPNPSTLVTGSACGCSPKRSVMCLSTSLLSRSRPGSCRASFPITGTWWLPQAAQRFARPQRQEVCPPWTEGPWHTGDRRGRARPRPGYRSGCGSR
jgi:hypothetical protein